jgi:hypothetical protein
MRSGGTCRRNEPPTKLTPIPNPRDSVRVAKVFQVGEQCDGIDEVPPDADYLLHESGVHVLQSQYNDKAVCRACTVCPDYSVTHIAWIWKRHRHLANELGYKKTD